MHGCLMLGTTLMQKGIILIKGHALAVISEYLLPEAHWLKKLLLGGLQGCFEILYIAFSLEEFNISLTMHGVVNRWGNTLEPYLD